VPSLFPDLFLGIQPRLIAREITNIESRVSLKKTGHRLSFMPSSSVHIEPDRIIAKTPVEMTQDLQEAFSISSFRTYDPEASQQGRHPARKIQPLLMLAGRRDSVGLPFLGPSPSQPWMQGEACFILENHRLPRPQVLEFFLTPDETVSLLPPGPEDKNSWLVSSDIPVDASTSGLVGFSVSPRSDALSVRLGWDRPHELGSDRRPGAIVPNAAPLPGQSLVSAGRAVSDL